eukprot:scaffold4902_cov115-Cylindrotheca_fusiformis.AAC.4
MSERRHIRLAAVPAAEEPEISTSSRPSLKLRRVKVNAAAVQPARSDESSSPRENPNAVSTSLAKKGRGKRVIARSIDATGMISHLFQEQREQDDADHREGSPPERVRSESTSAAFTLDVIEALNTNSSCGSSSTSEDDSSVSDSSTDDDSYDTYGPNSIIADETFETEGSTTSITNQSISPTESGIDSIWGAFQTLQTLIAIPNGSNSGVVKRRTRKSKPTSPRSPRSPRYYKTGAMEMLSEVDSSDSWIDSIDSNTDESFDAALSKELNCHQNTNDDPSWGLICDWVHGTIRDENARNLSQSQCNKGLAMQDADLAPPSRRIRSVGGLLDTMDMMDIILEGENESDNGSDSNDSIEQAIDKKRNLPFSSRPLVIDSDHSVESTRQDFILPPKEPLDADGGSSIIVVHADQNKQLSNVAFLKSLCGDEDQDGMTQSLSAFSQVYDSEELRQSNNDDIKIIDDNTSPEMDHSNSSLLEVVNLLNQELDNDGLFPLHKELETIEEADSVAGESSFGVESACESDTNVDGKKEEELIEAKSIKTSIGTDEMQSFEDQRDPTILQLAGSNMTSKESAEQSSDESRMKEGTWVEFQSNFAMDRRYPSSGQMTADAQDDSLVYFSSMEKQVVLDLPRDSSDDSLDKFLNDAQLSEDDQSVASQANIDTVPKCSSLTEGLKAKAEVDNEAKMNEDVQNVETEANTTTHSPVQSIRIETAVMPPETKEINDSDRTSVGGTPSEPRAPFNVNSVAPFQTKSFLDCNVDEKLKTEADDTDTNIPESNSTNVTDVLAAETRRSNDSSHKSVDVTHAEPGLLLNKSASAPNEADSMQRDCNNTDDIVKVEAEGDKTTVAVRPKRKKPLMDLIAMWESGKPLHGPVANRAATESKPASDEVVRESVSCAHGVTTLKKQDVDTLEKAAQALSPVSANESMTVSHKEMQTTDASVIEGKDESASVNTATQMLLGASSNEGLSVSPNALSPAGRSEEETPLFTIQEQTTSTTYRPPGGVSSDDNAVASLNETEGTTCDSLKAESVMPAAALNSSDGKACEASVLFTEPAESSQMTDMRQFPKSNDASRFATASHQTQFGDVVPVDDAGSKESCELCNEKAVDQVPERNPEVKNEADRESNLPEPMAVGLESTSSNERKPPMEENGIGRVKEREMENDAASSTDDSESNDPTEIKDCIAEAALVKQQGVEKDTVDDTGSKESCELCNEKAVDQVPERNPEAKNEADRESNLPEPMAVGLESTSSNERKPPMEENGIGSVKERQMENDATSSTDDSESKNPTVIEDCIAEAALVKQQGVEKDTISDRKARNDLIRAVFEDSTLSSAEKTKLIGAIVEGAPLEETPIESEINSNSFVVETEVQTENSGVSELASTAGEMDNTSATVTSSVPPERKKPLDKPSLQVSNDKQCTEWQDNAATHGEAVGTEKEDISVVSNGYVSDTKEVDSSQQKARTTASSDTKKNSDWVNREFGKRVLEGWLVLDASCPHCAVPLMTDTQVCTAMCVRCGFSSSALREDGSKINPLAPPGPPPPSLRKSKSGKSKSGKSRRRKKSIDAAKLATVSE